MIYSYDGELLDCDFLKGWSFNEEFVEDIYDEIQRMRTLNSVTGLADNYQMPKFRHHLRHRLPEIDMTMDTDTEIIGAKNVTFVPVLSKADIPDDVQAIMEFDNIKRQCDAHHEKVMRIASDLNSDHDEVAKNASEHLNRYVYLQTFI